MKWAKIPANAYSMEEIGLLMEQRRYKHLVLYFMLLSHIDSLRLKGESGVKISINIDEWAVRFRQKRTTFSIMLRELVAATSIDTTRWNENSSRIVLDLARSCFQPIESKGVFGSLERENKREREGDISPSGENSLIREIKREHAEQQKAMASSMKEKM